ncbi:hypothetical protein CVT26_002274 [Gymnopilus dilepis]|uniref:Uncharacterized protein n=1 Tax=Gymnopilus dilepis TaxID=231916 RepID=A0A409YN49_9AGAR|nr:hypothetical protein CVT26_002274 [Gymnopilus dilepis]
MAGTTAWSLTFRLTMTVEDPTAVSGVGNEAEAVKKSLPENADDGGRDHLRATPVQSTRGIDEPGAEAENDVLVGMGDTSLPTRDVYPYLSLWAAPGG